MFLSVLIAALRLAAFLLVGTHCCSCDGGSCSLGGRRSSVAYFVCLIAP